MRLASWTGRRASHSTDPAASAPGSAGACASPASTRSPATTSLTGSPRDRRLFTVTASADGINISVSPHVTRPDCILPLMAKAPKAADPASAARKASLTHSRAPTAELLAGGVSASSASTSDGPAYQSRPGGESAWPAEVVAISAPRSVGCLPPGGARLTPSKAETGTNTGGGLA
eukprot:scaffold1504_cov111-Isochrysis_galbana.AAC.5